MATLDELKKQYAAKQSQLNKYNIDKGVYDKQRESLMIKLIERRDDLLRVINSIEDKDIKEFLIEKCPDISKFTDKSTLLEIKEYVNEWSAFEMELNAFGMKLLGEV